MLHNKKFYSYFNPLFSAFSPLKISPCFMDNVVDFGREKFSENLDQISYRIFCYRALGVVLTSFSKRGFFLTEMAIASDGGAPNGIMKQESTNIEKTFSLVYSQRLGV